MINWFSGMVRSDYAPFYLKKTSILFCKLEPGNPL